MIYQNSNLAGITAKTVFYESSISYNTRNCISTWLGVNIFNAYIFLFYVHKYIHNNIYIYICIYVYIVVCLYVDLNININKYIYIYIYMYIYIYKMFSSARVRLSHLGWNKSKLSKNGSKLVQLATQVSTITAPKVTAP